MKKFVAAAAAVALTFAMTVPAMAVTKSDQGEKPPVVNPDKPQTDIPVNPDGNNQGNQDNQVPDAPNVTPNVTPNVQVSSPTHNMVQYSQEVSEEKKQSAMNAVQSDKKVQNALTDAGLSTKVEDIEVLGVYDVSGKVGTVAFAVSKEPGKGQKVVALHQLADGTWEVITLKKNADGNYEGVFNSFSPVVLAFVKEVTGGTGAATNPNKAPKTGDEGAVALIVSALA